MQEDGCTSMRKEWYFNAYLGRTIGNIDAGQFGLGLLDVGTGRGTYLPGAATEAMGATPGALRLSRMA